MMDRSAMRSCTKNYQLLPGHLESMKALLNAQPWGQTAAGLTLDEVVLAAGRQPQRGIALTKIVLCYFKSFGDLGGRL